MRRLALLFLATLPLAAAIAAPFAAAQDQPAPSLTLDPPILDAPDGEANATLVLHNPTSTTQRYHLSYETTDAVRVLLARENVSVAPGTAERITAKLRADPAVGDAERTVTFVATSLRSPTAVADAPEPNTAPLRADVTLRLVARAPSSTPEPRDVAQGTLRLLTPAVSVGPDGSAQGTIVVRNTGTEPFVPELTTSAGPALRFDFAAFPPLKPGDEVEVPFGVSLVADAPAGPRRIDIGAVGYAANAVTLRVDVLAPGRVPPPVSTTDAASGLPVGTLVAGAALAGVAGLGTIAWLTRRAWWPLLLTPLYTRLRPSKLLDHPIRERIVETVRTRPGITFSELARAVEVAPGQLTHHARMLEKGRILFSSPDGQTRRFYLIAEGRVAAVAPLAERALALIRASPRRASDLARELGVSRQALHYHLKQLAANGAIVARQEGRDLWLEAAAEPQPPSAHAGVART